MQQQGQKTDLNFSDVPKRRGQAAPGLPPATIEDVTDLIEVQTPTRAKLRFVVP